MGRHKKTFRERHKTVCTWITLRDCERLSALAKENGVSVAAFVRSIVVDALAEETRSFSKKQKAIANLNESAVHLP